MNAESTKTQHWWDAPLRLAPKEFNLDMRTLEAVRLVAQLSGQRSDSSEEWLRRLRKAAALIEVSALKDTEATKSVDAWAIVGLIYEAAGLFSSPQNDFLLLLSALAWQLATAPSIGLILAANADRGTLSSFTDHVERAAILFSRRDFAGLLEFSNRVLALAGDMGRKAVDSRDLDTAIESAILRSLAGPARDIAAYVTFSDSQLPVPGALRDLLTLTLSQGNPRRYRIARLLIECMSKFMTSSSRIVIDQVGTISAVSRKRISEYFRAYPELWPSQISAISAGLLDRSKRQFVVALPTSSGKTLCGEVVILQELSESPGAKCFYVVPTRALVTQKYLELTSKMGQFHFMVVGATGALQRDEIETSLIGGADIIVLTPEKLDLLIRHQDLSLDHATLFIIDETQMVEDNERGLGIEFVVIKLLLLKPDVRLLLLSAMLPNAEQYGRWLSAEATVSSSEWRPTRQRYGSVHFESLSPRGARLMLSLHDPSGRLTGVSVGLGEYSRKPATILEGLVCATEVLRRRGPLLVFCMTKDRCEEVVAAVVHKLEADGSNSPPSPKIEHLRQKIRREIAEGFLLERALAFKVAYHHADLPPRVRVELEELAASGVIEVLVSTTTLAEGVNLPISCVLFEDWFTHPDPRMGVSQEPLDITKFRNIAGRAGRAGKETEGLILLYEPERENKQIRVSKGVDSVSPLDYFLRDSYPPVISRFLEIIEGYKTPTDKDLDDAWVSGDAGWRKEVRGALRQFGTAVLHAMEVLNLDDEELIDAIIDKSLLAVQKPESKPKAREWFRVWLRHYHRVVLATEELRPLAMRVGLPLRAVQKLYEQAAANQDLLESFRAAGIANTYLSAHQASLASETVARIQELEWRPDQAPHGTLLTAWLHGASIQDLVAQYKPYLTEKTRHVERTCNYATQQLSNSGAWGMYALTRVLELILGESDLSPLAKRLPLFAYFGVDSIPAALLCLLGIERIDALRLGKAYISDGLQESTLPAVRDWARNIGRPKIMGILNGPDNRGVDEETMQILRVE